MAIGHGSMGFPTLALFAKHTFGLAVHERKADELAREAVAKAMVHESQSMLGKPALLPPPLAASTLLRRRRLGFGNTPLLMYGALRQSISWENQTTRSTGWGSPLPYAAFHENGGTVLGHPPQRSYLAAPARAKDRVIFALYCKIYRLTLPL